MSFIIALVIGALSIMLPGFFLSLALLRKTELSMFEIVIVGCIFGLIFPPTIIWLESFLIPYAPIFTFSNALYNVNVALLTIIGIVLSIQQGAISKESLNSMFSGFKPSTRPNIKQETEKDHKKRLANIRHRLMELNADVKIVRQHEKQEQDLYQRHQAELAAMSTVGSEERRKIEESHLEQEKTLYEEHEREETRLISEPQQAAAQNKSEPISYVWIILLMLMLIAFASRMLSIGTAPTYFEFDPYFDMVSTQYILTYGYQLLWDHAAWPSLVGGTIHRLQPLVPYLEAYWYNLAGATPSAATINTTLLSLVSSWYPPITAALLVFVVFMFLYREYGEFEALMGAALATSMPILISTFIAGEQLVEPWGIFALFFFYATYLLAANKPEEPRYAILAGIAFASNFLGAHYYTLTAGILAGYIVLQGVVNILRGKDSKNFYKMNAIVIAVIVIFFIFYNAYGATLTERTPTIIGIPVIVGFPLFALLGIFVADLGVKKLSENRQIARINSGETVRYAFLILLLIFLVAGTIAAYEVVGYLIFVAPLIMLEIVAYPVIANYILKKTTSPAALRLMLGIEVLVILGILAALFIAFTPLGKPVFSYIQLSKKFTTASSPLFMTVQEYEPTGLSFNYGSGGLGLIASSIAGIPILVFGVLIAFSILVLLAIYSRDSKSGILSYAAVWSVAVAGMIEVKYLPHFGIAYIIALCAIFGELAIYYSNRQNTNIKKYLMYTGVAIVVLASASPAYQLLTAAANPNCNTLGNNQLGAVLYCNTVPQYWLDATAWMKANVGPYGSRILSWWDYGDWINWFGNSNAVIRGDNSVAAQDYAVAAHYVLTPQEGVNTSNLQSFTDSVQAKYMLFDDQLVPKWGALDFLACVDINQTSEQYAIAQGAQYGQPYALGTSACEIKHDPAYVFIPISQNINNYCTLPGNSTEVALHGFVIVGQNPTNQTYCVPIAAINNGETTYLLNPNGTKSNAILTPAYFGGETTISGQQYVSFMLLYAPNSAGKITNAPSLFYNSTYYQAFFLGKLPGFTMVYPSNFTGINFVNSTSRVIIFQSNNYTGTPVNVTQKPSYVHNNYTMPG